MVIVSLLISPCILLSQDQCRTDVLTLRGSFHYENMMRNCLCVRLVRVFPPSHMTVSVSVQQTMQDVLVVQSTEEVTLLLYAILTFLPNPISVSYPQAMKAKGSTTNKDDNAGLQKQVQHVVVGGC